MGRLLLGITIAYCLFLVLGVSREAAQARRDLEVPRRRPRHGTARTLSVLSVAMPMVSRPRWRNQAYGRLQGIAARTRCGLSALARAPNPLAERVITAA